MVRAFGQHFPSRTLDNVSHVLWLWLDGGREEEFVAREKLGIPGHLQRPGGGREGREGGRGGREGEREGGREGKRGQTKKA